MEQSETASDLAPRKLVRQLNFAAVYGDPSHLKLPPPSPSPSPPPPSHSPLRLQLDLLPPGQRPWLCSEPQEQQAWLYSPRLKLVSPVRRIPHPVKKLPVKVLQVAGWFACVRMQCGAQCGDQTDNITAQYQQEIDPMASSPSFLSDSFVSDPSNTRISASSRSTYRSVLADFFQPQNVKNLCSLFVVLSQVAAKTNAEMIGKVDQQTKTGNFEASVASSSKSLQETRDVHQLVCDDHVNKDEADAVDIANYNRPLSPETLALMCDEQDDMIFGNSSANGVACNSTLQNMIQKSSNSDGCTDVCREQERLILTKFLDVLRGLVTHGSIKETMCSSSTKKGERSKKEPADNANIGAETNVGREKGIHNNSFGNYLIPSVTKISQTNYAVTNGHGNNDLSLT